MSTVPAAPYYLTPSVLQRPQATTLCHTATEPAPACPACGSPLIEIRQKLQCVECHTICETCCEGGRH